MEPRNVIVGKRWNSKTVELISGPEFPIAELDEKFMPFRMNRSNADFEWAALCRLEVERLERFSKAEPSVAPKKEGKSPMKSLKSIVSLIAFVAIAFFTQASAEAQSYNFGGFFGTSPLGSTVNIATVTTNSTMYLTNGASSANGGPAFTKAWTYGAFQPVFRLTGSGTSACVATFDTSVDGNYWNAGAFTISVTANGTNWVTGLSNQTLGSIGFVRLASITNPNASAITNLVVLTSGKAP